MSKIKTYFGKYPIINALLLLFLLMVSFQVFTAVIYVIAILIPIAIIVLIFYTIYEYLRK